MFHTANAEFIVLHILWTCVHRDYNSCEPPNYLRMRFALPRPPPSLLRFFGVFPPRFTGVAISASLGRGTFLDRLDLLAS